MVAARNVLIIMGDEHQRRALSCTDHPVVETPNLDALAAAGTRFTSCWTPSPICVPARGSFATGRWVHDIGTWHSAQPWYGAPEGFTHRARSRGHDVRSFGKLHHRSADDDDGFVERHRPMFVAGGVGWIQGLSRREPLPFDEAAELAAQVGSGHTSYTRYDQAVTDEAVAWLETRSDDGPPFVAFVSLVAPHFPLSAPDEWTERYPLAEIPPPEIPNLVPRNPAVAAMRRLMPYDRYFVDDDHVQRGRRAYFALCSWLDHNVGRVLDALGRAGLADDTLVIYTSDHGELAGNRGLWCKSFMYEDSVGVPLILRGPGVPTRATIETPVNLVDIAPTVDQVTGATAPGLAGSSLVDLATADATPDRPAFSEYHDGGSITGSFALRLGEWKFVEHVGYPPELYDLSVDPDELVDLGTDARCRDVRARLASALRDICDPEVADAEAFASQDALLAALGGRDAVATGVRFNHTPVPGDDDA